MTALARTIARHPDLALCVAMIVAALVGRAIALAGF